MVILKLIEKFFIGLGYGIVQVFNAAIVILLMVAVFGWTVGGFGFGYIIYLYVEGYTITSIILLCANLCICAALGYSSYVNRDK